MTVIDRVHVGKFSLPDMTTWARDYREEVEARGEFFAALTKLAEKLQFQPIGQWTTPDDGRYRYFLTPTATPGVYTLVMAPSDHKEHHDPISEVFEFDSVEGQDADDYHRLTGYVKSITNNLVMDGFVPQSLIEYYKAFSVSV